MAILSLKRLSDNKQIVIEEENIILLKSISGGTSVEHINPISGYVDKVEVANAIAQVASVSENIFEITPTLISGTVYLNFERVVNIFPYGANSYAKILYDRGGTAPIAIETEDSIMEAYTAIYDKKGYLTYEVASYTATTIVLAAGEGNVTSVLTSPKVITLYGSTDANNGTYVVTSSAFGSETTITLPASSITDTASVVGYVMVKS